MSRRTAATPARNAATKPARDIATTPARKVASGPAGAGVRFFVSAAAFRAWLARHHATAPVLWVGFHRKATGKGGITYPEALDEALAHGWIDGVRRTVHEGAYTLRFSPRKAESLWSALNVRRMEALIAEGRAAAPGLAAFARRDRARTDRHAEARASAALSAEHRRRFRADARAWTFFSAQPAGYRRLMAWWIVSAKREETRDRRLAALIATSSRGERIPLTGGAAAGRRLGKR